ncbi:MAG: HPr family phosphocarrier protein [Lachnospiraceae bacterium]|nr:HPr family phosphocarrier protein [Lachnospiraceae bacterium]
MNTCKVKLNTLEKVKNFVTEISKSGNQYDLVSGSCCVDATSVLGILSLDLTRPIVLKAKETNIEIPESILAFAA